MTVQNFVESLPCECINQMRKLEDWRVLRGKDQIQVIAQSIATDTLPLFPGLRSLRVWLRGAYVCEYRDIDHRIERAVRFDGRLKHLPFLQEVVLIATNTSREFRSMMTIGMTCEEVLGEMAALLREKLSVGIEQRVQK